LADAEQQCLAKIAETKQDKQQLESIQKQLEQCKAQEQATVKTIQQCEEQIKQLESNAKDADRFHCDKIQ